MASGFGLRALGFGTDSHGPGFGTQDLELARGARRVGDSEERFERMGLPCEGGDARRGHSGCGGERCVYWQTLAWTLKLKLGSLRKLSRLTGSASGSVFRPEVRSPKPEA